MTTARSADRFVDRDEILRLHRGPWKRSGEWMMAFCPVPAHDDGAKHGGRGGQSLGLSDTGVLRCFAGCSFNQVMEVLRAPGGQPSPAHSDPVAIYTYIDVDGVAWEKGRFEGKGDKRFAWRRANTIGWLKGKSGVVLAKLPLLGADEVLATPDVPVIYVEGEEKKKALTRAGFLAVTAAGGSSQRDFGNALKVLHGRDLYLWPDNDNPGEKYTQHVAKMLQGIAAGVRVVCWRQAPASGDASDALQAGVDVQGLIDAAEPIKAANPSIEPLGHLNLVGPILLRIADVKREEVEWRWQHRIPKGKLTMIEGDPDTGKSFLTMALATAETTGAPLPGDSGYFEAMDVLILTAEDGLGDTVRPRLEDMGADLNRVVALTAVRDSDGVERFPNLKDDLLMVEEALSSGRFSMMIIDPINAYLGGIDGNRDTDIRSVLGPLAAIAERYRIAVIAVRHLTKGGRDKAIYRGLGGIGYTAAARSVLLVGKNRDDESERVVVCIKHNLAPDSPAIGFEINEGRFAWRGESSVSAGELLAPDLQPEERSVREEAAEFLLEALADGPRPQPEVTKEARALGISEKTLRRAKGDLGVVSTPRYEPGRRGAAGHDWKLSEVLGQKYLDGRVSTHGHLGHLNGPESEPTASHVGVGHVNSASDEEEF